MVRQAVFQRPRILELLDRIAVCRFVSLVSSLDDTDETEFSGYMPPFIFISVYAREKLPHISTQLANLPISIMSFASAIGRTTIGLTGDRIGFVNAFILVILISCFSQAVLWNVASESYAGIMVFS